MAVKSAYEYVAKNNDFSEYEHLPLLRIDRNGTHYYVEHKCPKCGGTGVLPYYSHVEGGTCFLCGGSGQYDTTIIVRTEEYVRKLGEQRLARARKAAPAKNAAFLKAEGFSADGKTYVVLGDTYAIREDLKVAGAKFNYFLGWHFSAPNDKYETVELTKDTVLCETDDEVVTLLRELPNGVLDWPWDPCFVQEYVAKLQDEYKARTAPKTEFFGTVGQKVELALSLEHRSSYETQWGETTIYAFVDEGGRHFIWKTSTYSAGMSDVNTGDKVVLKGTIKEHNEYKGCKQTVLTRCKVVA